MGLDRLLRRRLVLSVVGLAVGFLIFFGFALVIAGIIMFFTALAAITDPTPGLAHLAPKDMHLVHGFAYAMPAAINRLRPEVGGGAAPRPRARGRSTSLLARGLTSASYS